MRGPLPVSRSARPPLWREAFVGLEAAALLRDPVFRGDGVSDGGGRPVLLIPGCMAGDGSLSLMAGWLKRTGHRPSRAGMWANVDCAGGVVPRLEERLERLVAEQGQRAAIAVHPLVRLQVEAVSRLGSLGAPGLFRRECLAGECCASFWEDLAAPLARDVACVSVYSKRDGIVDWQACLDPYATASVEIRASHCGMAVSPAAWRAVADALGDFSRSEARSRRGAVARAAHPA